MSNEHFGEAMDLFIEKDFEYPDARDVASEYFCANEFKKGLLQAPKTLLLHFKERVCLGIYLPEGDHGDLCKKLKIYLFCVHSRQIVPPKVL